MDVSDTTLHVRSSPHAEPLPVLNVDLKCALRFTIQLRNPPRNRRGVAILNKRNICPAMSWYTTIPARATGWTRKVIDATSFKASPEVVVLDLRVSVVFVIVRLGVLL